MSFDPILAEKRFGFGLSPMIAPPESAGAMLDGVEGPDQMHARFPIENFEMFLSRLEELRGLRRGKQENPSAENIEAADQAILALGKRTRVDWQTWLTQSIMRFVWTETAFRERLAFFWADHFTAVGKHRLLKSAAGPFAESTTRPYMSGKFEDMLISASIHPMMQHYLDQDLSVGPNSQHAKKKGKGQGLNENLAREILELHTLGVDGPYTQGDVRQFAELLTGLRWNAKKGIVYSANRAEPGAERILGKWYGSQKGHIGDIKAFLRDLARHPATAHYLSTKLARHFVSDTPDQGMIQKMEAAYLQTNGELLSVYKAMLEHPAAWSTHGANVKQPVTFVGSSLRALAIDSKTAAGWSKSEIRRFFQVPLEIMGQSWQKPLGPDGWPEADGHWATPQGLAARMQWALRLPEIVDRELPDPRAFVTTALGPDAPDRVVFAAEAAENRREGVALVLMSPAFQRH